MALRRMRVAVCEHGVGNVRSVVRAVARVAPSADIVVTKDPDAVRSADRIVVPGQGSFGAFAKAMHDGTGLDDALKEAIGKGTPYLGICLGLQVLFESSEEAPGERGLAIYEGDVQRLRADALPLPHVGWNSVALSGALSGAVSGALLGAVSGAVSGALSGPHDERFFYFAHSYVAVPKDASLVGGTTAYGDERFASIVARDNVLAVQFHPEKSQREGLALLERFFAK